MTPPEDASEALPLEDQAFHVELRGIDYVPESERWATPRNIGALWAGSSFNIEYFVYGALLMGFGFSFWTALWLIIIGNLSFLLLGVASLQGPLTGTTAFTATRAAFGTRGARILSFFNWLTQLGFETEGLILIVGATIVLFQMGGVHVNDPEKVIFIVLAATIQAVMPYFGHATMVKLLRWMIAPFAIIFIWLAVYDLHDGSTRVFTFGHGWELFMAGLAFVIALSGLGWTECGNDYTRYLKSDASRGSIVGWVFVGTALPEIVMMILGALTYSFVSTSTVWNSANPFEALRGAHAIPSAFIVIFLLFAIVQLFAINSLDLYSSGVSLQAMGLRLRRYQAVILDSVIACGLTIYAEFGSTFATYMKEFVGVIIVWIAPWFGIFITDWILRKFRYNPSELQRTDSEGIYYGHAGFNWNAIAAFVIGLVCATMAYSKAPPPINFPFHWMTPLANHYGAFYCNGTAAANCGPAGWFGGADFSVYIGIGLAAIIYAGLELATGYIRRQQARDAALSAAPVLHQPPRPVGAENGN